MSFYTVAWGWKPRPKNSMHLGMVLAFRQANRLVVLVQLLAVVEHPAVAGWVRRGVFIGMFMGHIEHIYIMYYIYIYMCVLCIYIYIYIMYMLCICYVYVMYMLCICYVYVIYVYTVYKQVDMEIHRCFPFGSDLLSG